MRGARAAALAANGGGTQLEGGRRGGGKGAVMLPPSSPPPQPAMPRRRAASAAGDNGKKTGRGSEAAAKKKAEPSVPVYDSSDSFENRVIGLRGDQSQDANVRDDGLSTLRNTYVRLDNRNRWKGSDLDSNAHTASGHGHLSNGKYPNAGKGGTGAEEGTSQGSAKARQHGFIPGQVAWAKFARFPWWPAQVMDEREVNAERICDPASEADILVRFFGTYDYGWVNPFENLTNFDVKLAERSRIRKKALQKGVEEAIAFQTSGKLPELWESLPKTVQKAQKTPHKSHNGQSNGKVESDKPSQNDKPSEKTPRKRKPKVVFEEKDVEKKPQKVLRRLRVMRQLGLVAPAGSPFAVCS